MDSGIGHEEKSDHEKWSFCHYLLISISYKSHRGSWYERQF